MTDIKEQYVTATVALLAEGQDTAKVFKGLRATMNRRGHGRLLPGVLSSLLAVVSRREQLSVPHLTLARESDAKSHQDVAHSTVIIDPSIIGGYIHRQGFSETDNSHKTRLLNWYKAAIKK
jgi:F0F1-type ATP synthase delta subunit